MKHKAGLLLVFIYLRLMAGIGIFFGLLWIVNSSYSLLLISISLLVISTLGGVTLAILGLTENLRWLRQGEMDKLRRRMLFLKWGSVPFFLLNFCCWYFLFMALVGGSRGLVFFTPIPLLFCYGVVDAYGVLLASSASSVPYLCGLKHQGALSSAGFALHLVLQLLFVLDILDVLFLGRSSLLSRGNAGTPSGSHR